jgi:hypothetical protein
MDDHEPAGAGSQKWEARAWKRAPRFDIQLIAQTNGASGEGSYEDIVWDIAWLFQSALAGDDHPRGDLGATGRKGPAVCPAGPVSAVAIVTVP